MDQYGPLISYDVSRLPITMKVSTRISRYVEQVFREDYKLQIKLVAHQGDQVTFTFDESIVDADAFLRHLQTATPKQYGSV